MGHPIYNANRVHVLKICKTVVERPEMSVKTCADHIDVEMMKHLPFLVLRHMREKSVENLCIFAGGVIDI